MKKKVKNIKELKEFAKFFIKNLEKKPNKEANLILLNGDLGSGKTTFVQQIGKIMGVKKNMNSPTFVILKKYEIENNRKWKKIIHIDAYRLKNKTDLKNIGLLDEMNNRENLIFIEWGNLIEKFLPKKNTQKIYFEYSSNKDEREISFQ